MTNKIVFDDKAHSIISELLDNTEDWLVRHKKCEPQAANDRLAYDYIQRCADMIFGANVFLTNDERIATEFFMLELRGAKGKLRSARNRVACTAQLMQFQQLYFPNYQTVLRISFLSALSKIGDKNRFILSGLIKLASAKLPGVRNDLRRELRRLGYPYDALLVADDTLERQLEQFKPDLLTIGG